MRYCSRCGQELEENTQFCPSCKTQVGNYDLVHYNQDHEWDTPNYGYALLSFFFPIVIGLTLYLIWQDKYPLKSKLCGKGALLGGITYVVLFVCLIVTFIIAGGSEVY